MAKAATKAFQCRKAELEPGTLWRHFRGKIVNLVTEAHHYNNKDKLVVLQDIISAHVTVRPLSEFNQTFHDGRRRYVKYVGSLLSARLENLQN